MDRERLDSLIDRELRNELSVAPSADFHARLDERLALERERRIRPRWFTFGLVTAAAAAIVLVAVLMRAPARDQTTSTAPPIVATAPARTAPPIAAAPSAPDVQAERTTVGRAAAQSRPGTVLPDVEVIVPRGQADVIRQFADNLRDDMGNRGWIPVLAAAAPVPDGFVIPSAPTIDRLPMVSSYDPERE